VKAIYFSQTESLLLVTKYLENSINPSRGNDMRAVSAGNDLISVASVLQEAMGLPCDTESDAKDKFFSSYGWRRGSVLVDKAKKIKPLLDALQIDWNHVVARDVSSGDRGQ
jgi:hypothetical protein